MFKLKTYAVLSIILLISENFLLSSELSPSLDPNTDPINGTSVFDYSKPMLSDEQKSIALKLFPEFKKIIQIKDDDEMSKKLFEFIKKYDDSQNKSCSEIGAFFLNLANTYILGQVLNPGEREAFIDLTQKNLQEFVEKNTKEKDQ